jgi:hypothetical protein
MLRQLVFFFGTEINPENELVCERRIDEFLLEVELCYINNDPTEPILMRTERVNVNAFQYKRYPVVNS